MDPTRKKVQTIFQRIAQKHKITNNELLKVWKSQFLFAKEKLEKYEKDYLSEASEEELKEIVIKFIYLGKIYTKKSLQDYGIKFNKLKGENMSKTKKNNVIKKSDKRTELNLTPISNWMVTTAYIEAATSSFFVGTSYKPTFLNMQQVLAVGPRVEDVKLGDWVYIDMSRFIKTTKKKSTIRAGVGGEDMISEQLVPPVFAAPGDETTYFKINDREIEGVIKDPFSMKKEYDTLENYVALQGEMEKEANDAKEKQRLAQWTGKEPANDRKGPAIRTSTSPKLNG